MITIRKSQISDLKRVEYVCKMTAGELSRTVEAVGNMVANTYSAYYIRECTDTCFVLDSDGEAVGYILCEPNCKRFEKIYRKKDVKNIANFSKIGAIKAYFYPFLYSFFGKKYPAHLHINLLPEYQNSGYGSKMVEALLAELSSRGVKGVMLATDTDNDGAIRFYKRHGFKVLVSACGGTAMGKRLDK